MRLFQKYGVTKGIYPFKVVNEGAGKAGLPLKIILRFFTLLICRFQTKIDIIE